MPPSFHGYIANKGTGTAWKDMLKEVVVSPNIYEIDFKQFFPSIRMTLLGRALKAAQFPDRIIESLLQMSESMPILGKMYRGTGVLLPKQEWILNSQQIKNDRNLGQQ
jgi:hypothetical protein